MKDLMTAAEVAPLFGVDPKTVVRWERAGKINCIRTLGGHRRFRREDVEPLLEKLGTYEGWKETMGGPPPAS